MVMSPSQQTICDGEVSSMSRKGAVTKVGTANFVSGFFLVPKSSGAWRPILNLKPLNRFIVYRHFKMESLDNVRHLLRPGYWMGKVDLRDAYFTVPIHTADRKFLQFRWGGEIWQFTCMAFGLSAAPWVFTKLIRPVTAWLRARGVRIVAYLDDFFVCGPSVEKVRESLSDLRAILEWLGFVINDEKSVEIPVQQLQFLGFMIDSNLMTLSLTQEKRASISKKCIGLLSAKRVSARELASVLGLMSWSSPAVAYAPAHYRNLQCQYNEVISVSGGDMQAKIELSGEAKLDLQWWVRELPTLKGRPLFEQQPALVIYSDASRSGWGRSVGTGVHQDPGY
jgi:hypothetical protein